MTGYDAIIIGFGKGGKTLAGELAKQGKKVALVEKSDKMYGGTCINVGCIPSKSLVKNAARATLRENASWKEKEAFYAEAVQEKEKLTAMLRKKNFDKLDQLEQVTIYHGTAEFLDDTRIQVRMGEELLEISGKRIYINTGAEPVVPKLEGIKDNPQVYFSETLMSEPRLPAHLVILGAGYIGLEFASMYRNFGSEVTVLQDGSRFLPREDEDVAQAIKEILEKRGVRFILGAKVQKLQEGTVVYEKGGKKELLTADAILIATGRKPNTAKLGLERAGVQMDARGAVITDEERRTSVPHIWAMGDVNGGQQFTYTSLDDYRIISAGLRREQAIETESSMAGVHADNSGNGGNSRNDENSGNSYRLSDRKNVPYSVFLDTPYARVGRNEQELQAAGVPYRVAKLPTAAIPKAQVLGKTEGFLKALVHEKTGEILGVMLLCEESYEMINIVKLAMDLGADAGVLENQIFTHPTMSEALNDLFGGF